MLTIRSLEESDIEIIAAAFDAIGWASHKPLIQYQRYFNEQMQGERLVLVAYREHEFAGYLTIVWQTDYEPFRAEQIPEVQDFNVLPKFRRQKIGSALMDAAEVEVAARSSVVGIGVGLYPDYGHAQRLYVLRGYVPDGRGVTYNRQVLEPMARVTNDDDLALYFTKELVITSNS